MEQSPYYWVVQIQMGTSTTAFIKRNDLLYKDQAEFILLLNKENKIDMLRIQDLSI